MILLFFSLPTWAQTIKGTVMDAQSKDPLPGANIVQVGTENGVASDNNGHFTLQLISKGQKELKVSYVGYKTQTVDVSDKAQKKITIYLIPKTIMSSAVQIKGLRVDKKSAVTYDNISAKQIQRQNLGQQIPFLLKFTPSVVTTSDDGMGIGYTGIRIRGVDPTRINVTINGIPLNDSESQQVYWVDLPGLASSIQSMQIQRGVGTSTNGESAFGASINIQTT
ncbi:MAG TPA: carboxypeptidase-like regulatory domain-containing protein, partial [Balneolales bacterium]|nr:carboxypeptidase-like regulatory domain-containing protein [Balneolales bacterium]